MRGDDFLRLARRKDGSADGNCILRHQHISRCFIDGSSLWKADITGGSGCWGALFCGTAPIDTTLHSRGPLWDKSTPASASLHLCRCLSRTGREEAQKASPFLGT